jgi:mono/diheme cytochrome c family protein
MLLLRVIFITEYFSFMKKSYQSFEDNSNNNMKKVKTRKISLKHLMSSLMFFLIASTALLAQEGDPVAGKALFNTNCAACHNLDKKMVGPALRNVEQRLADDKGLDREWLYSWIRNSSAMIKSGDAYANEVYNEYGGAAMTAFPQLSDEDLNNILAYTAQEKATPPPATTAAEATTTQASNSGITNELILGALCILFVLLALGLYMVNRALRRFAKASQVEFEEEIERSPIWKAFVKNQFLMLVTSIFFLLASAYFAYGYFMQLGVDQGYQPVQPIHFSHKIHAGDNKVDCNYCHSSARVSKHSGIPSLNICMNCHKSIYEYNGETTAEYSKEFYDAEIQKLYDAVGWSDADQKYTGDTKPVKWIRIHNLPDLAYFNHSQHVSVGGIECQTCHGPVEEMEIVYQHSPLTMGWCINCHRETNVKVKDNEYYEKIHEELSKKYGVEQLTAAQMGGLECGKCHY